MALGHSALIFAGCGLAFALSNASHTVAAAPQDPVSPLGIATARVSIAGTSNIHEYTASTTTVRVTRVQLTSGLAGPNFWEEIVKPGAIEAFDVAIPAAKLTSPKDGLDKNMHKALKVKEHPDITFKLARLEAAEGGGLKAIGTLQIAGVERQVTLALTTARKESGLAVKGEIRLLMTDFGITPPKAMLGMLKTDPKVMVSFETLLAVPLT